MSLVKDLNDAKLSVNATLFELTQHLFDVWYMWTDLRGSGPGEPASFVSQLLMSMPTAPEGPIVHTRRWLVDLIAKDDSLLRDIDGERMASYAKSLGVQDRPGALWIVVVPPKGGARGMTLYSVGGNKTDSNKCNECLSYACKRQNGTCICRWDSSFPLSNIKQKGRRDYVQLMRAYNKANPDKSLKVSVRVVKEAVEGPSTNAMYRQWRYVQSQLLDPGELSAWG